MFIYGYSDLCRDVNRLKGSFDVFSIGRSVCGRDIVCIRCGSGKRKIMLNGTHHGAESITAALLLKLARDAVSDAGFLSNCSVYIVPMVNPDGAELVKCGCESFFNSDFLIKANGGSKDFSKWQANARGVDLNHNYDAGWSEAKKLEKEYGAEKPGRTRFGGYAPHSEPETKAMVEFTEVERFDIAAAYHTQGREIYYAYPGITPVSVLGVALKMSEASGYELSNPRGIASFGGYRDWFVKKFRKPCFTIEAGLGENPLDFNQLDEIYEENKHVLTILG